MLKSYESHYELWINQITNKPTIISSPKIKDLITSLSSLDKKKPLVVFASSGIAGANIKEMVHMTKEEAESFSFSGINLIRRLLMYEPLVIGIFDRYLLGGGLEIALACDISIVTANCKVGFPEVTLGITPGWLGIELCAMKSTAIVKELLFLGKIIEAKDSLSYSLFNHVCEDWQHSQVKLNKILDRLDKISYTAVSNAKNNYLKCFSSFNSTNTTRYFSLMFEEYDQLEGMKAYLEKRNPSFLKDQ